MKRAVIFTGNQYPDGDAGALRQHVIAKMLIELGYAVFIYGMGNSTGLNVNQYENVSYISMRSEKTRISRRIIDRLTWGGRAFNDMTNRFDRVDVILLVDDNPGLMNKIVKYKHKNNTNIIIDCVEWYSPEEFKTGKKSIRYLMKNYINSKAIDKEWNVIAISTYLYNWFYGRANRVSRIPVVFDTNTMTPSKAPNNQFIQFVYAGSPVKKDYLNELIKGFALLRKQDKEKIELHVIGVTTEQLINQCDVDRMDIQSLGESLKVHGRVSHEEAVEWVSKANYTLLLRNSDLRYAKAGFPTKIVESLKYGTPPMCNLSSDLSEYLNDLKNALIIKDCTAESVKEAAEKAISIGSDEYAKMRKNARETAIDKFDYHKYIKTLGFLLEEQG